VNLPASLLRQLRAMVEPVSPEGELHAILEAVRSLKTLSPALKQGVALAIVARGVALW
jgi:hypothetical protein